MFQGMKQPFFERCSVNKKVITESKELFARCEALAKVNKRAVIVIDGRAASGKSTLADSIAQSLCGHVVHADDFFLPFDMRTADRLSQAGGNIHYERFAEEVVKKLDGDFDYGVFSCSEGKVTHHKHIPAHGPVIVEGAYSALPLFGKYYDLLVFVSASFDARMERIIRRNGTERAEVFRDKWIPLEEHYFETFAIEENADIIFDTTDA